jgi:hypothetical protein
MRVEQRRTDVAVLANSGTSASDPWLLEQTTDVRPLVARTDGPNGTWTESPLGYAMRPIRGNMTRPLH